MEHVRAAEKHDGPAVKALLSVAVCVVFVLFFVATPNPTGAAGAARAISTWAVQLREADGAVRVHAHLRGLLDARPLRRRHRSVCHLAVGVVKHLLGCRHVPVQVV